MSNLGAIDYQWTGDVMRPLQRYLAKMQDRLVAGAVYTLEPSRRSRRSHNHQFAEIDEAWRSLPNAVREEFHLRDADDLRKWALCQTRFCIVDPIACPSLELAQRLMRSFRRVRGDDYILCAIHPEDDNDPGGPCVLVSKTAYSQNKKSMGGDEFQRSKDAILDVLARLLGTTVEELKRAAREAA